LAGDRLDRVVAEVAASFGTEAVDVTAHSEIAAAASVARWAKAWAPDFLLSFYAHDGALAAWVSSRLLDLPFGMVFSSMQEIHTSRLSGLLDRMVGEAALIVLSNPTFVEEFERRFPNVSPDRLIVLGKTWSPLDKAAEVMTRCLGERLAARTRADLGPAAAFVTDATASAGLRLPSRPYFVAGAERTGSNLLVGMLVTHPGVDASGEIYNPRMMDDGVIDTALPPEIDAKELVALRAKDPVACHLRLMEIARHGGRDIAGFKLLYFHGMIDNRIIDHLVSLPRQKVVHLLRSDRLARFLSHVRADLSDTWWVAKADAPPPKPEPVELDPTQALYDFEMNRIYEERFDATFAGVETMRINYEAMCRDLDVTARKVLDFLGAEQLKVYVGSQKTGESDPRRGIRNYEALEATFQGTYWAHQFERGERGALRHA
jgi:hypothetical protein